MTPFEASFEYLHLLATNGAASAIQFAHDYENSATIEDYAEYLDILETKLGSLNVEEVSVVETHDEYGGTTGAPIPGYLR